MATSSAHLAKPLTTPPPPPPSHQSTGAAPSVPGVQLPSVSTLLRPSEHQHPYQSHQHHHHHYPHHPHHHGSGAGAGSGGSNTMLPPPPASDIVTHMHGRPVYESSKCTSALVGSMFVQPATIDYQGRKALLFPFAVSFMFMVFSFPFFHFFSLLFFFVFFIMNQTGFYICLRNFKFHFVLC